MTVFFNKKKFSTFDALFAFKFRIISPTRLISFDKLSPLEAGVAAVLEGALGCSVVEVLFDKSSFQSLPVTLLYSCLSSFCSLSFFSISSLTFLSFLPLKNY